MISNKCNIETDIDARYSSYPATPYWNETKLESTRNKWISNIKSCLKSGSRKDGISLYIHLPFCESLCSFCSYNPYITKNHNNDYQYIDYVIKEWHLYLKLLDEKPYIKQLYVGGGTPTFFSHENLSLLFTKIISTARVDANSVLEIEGHVNNTDFQHLFELNKLGFSNINVGIQDFDPKVQHAINRVQSYESVKKITETAIKTGYNCINYDLIYGLPFQSRKTAINNIYKIRELKPSRVRLFEYIHCPEKNPAQKKYTEHLPIELEKNAFLSISKEMLKESGYFNIGMNNFVQKTDPLFAAMNSKTLHKNIMGFTTQHTKLSIGLGASAISDSWNATVQNERSLNAYYGSIDKNTLPLSKGYFLSKEDYILRRHILNLQCKYETKWDIQKKDNSVLKKYIAGLWQYEKFNLVKISENSIKIRKAGREFVRDICNVLDSRIVNMKNLEIEKSENEVFYGVKI